MTSAHLVKLQKVDFNQQATFQSGSTYRLITLEEYDAIEKRFVECCERSLGTQRYFRLSKKQYAVALLMI